MLGTEELQARPSRQPDHEAESRALRELARELAHSPAGILDRLTEKARELCRANSTGISICEIVDGKEIFRWRSVCGELAPFLHATVPRDFSPCGIVLDRDCAQLLVRPASHFDYIADFGFQVEEILMVPFYQRGRAVGTIWAVHGSSGGRFDLEDSRLLHALAEFTSASVQAYTQIEDLAQAVANLERERDLRERFVAALSHDLRTPMTAAKINAQMILRRADDSVAVRTMARRITASVDRADRMIRDLLDANRIRAGEGIPLNISDCSLGDILRNVTREMADLHGNRFQLNLGGQDATGNWDARAIHRVVENLIGNAVKYGTSGAIVTLGFEQTASWVDLFVHNEGNPVPETELETLFIPYRRTDSANSSGQKGWGLGLTLVKGIAEAHGGSARAESSSEKGTTFFVRLPKSVPEGFH